jgi:hypothetical protein
VAGVEAGACNVVTTNLINARSNINNMIASAAETSKMEFKYKTMLLHITRTAVVTI